MFGKKPRCDLKYRYSDGGAKKNGYAASGKDCVTRAIAIATGQNYKSVRKYLCDKTKTLTFGIETNVQRGVYLPVYCAALADMGWEAEAVDSMYLRDVPKKGVYIVALNRHLVCVKDGVVFDTHDSRKCNRSKSGSPVVKGIFRKRA